MSKSFFLSLTTVPLLITIALFSSSCSAPKESSSRLRSETLLKDGWRFCLGDPQSAMSAGFDDSSWEGVTIPHDWAIFGPFDRSNDLQVVAVTQNFETEASEKTGRSGGLPWVGTGWYRRSFDVPKGKTVNLVFDGAMSEAQVFVNGEKVCFWPYGYNSFYCDITPFLTASGEGNVLAVRLENKSQSSRWYPGAGLYRNVRLVVTEPVHIPVWGTWITTPEVSSESASVNLQIKVAGGEGETLNFRTEIVDSLGHTVAQCDTASEAGCSENTEAAPDSILRASPDRVFAQSFVVKNPSLWSPESPSLYKAVTKVYADDVQVDEYVTSFGIRSIEVIPEKGFFLNGQPRKFKGVCNHHDLGPLGAAVNKAALRHQLVLLKEMGCDAIRTSHNMPDPQLVELCDEMGFMMMVEPFDEWDVAKCDNGYHRFFNEWAEKDMVNMLRHYRNNPSVVMWSIGNEVPSQWMQEGLQVAAFLQGICHREDPSRPVTCGMDQVTAVLSNGFAALLDVPGLNYRTQLYKDAYDKLPQKVVLGSETASTVSSRGVYKFPARFRASVTYDDHQSSGYDLESCFWSNVPDVDMALADDYPWTMGQFVWTGFDYLGEPSPYDTDAWPSHSSVFGIIDLASLPKDRYYLYRSLWNTRERTLHVLPHWTWPGREGVATPVFVYTDYPSAELFVNGKSQGIRHKLTAAEAGNSASAGEGVSTSSARIPADSLALLSRYRLMWLDVPYEPGELKVIAYDASGVVADVAVVRTAGEPDHLSLSVDRSELSADGEDLAYITVSVVDKDGNLCPYDGRLVSFSVRGAGRYRAAANGDPACLDLFHLPQMHAFGGQLTAIVQSLDKSGKILFTAEADGLKSAQTELKSR